MVSLFVRVLRLVHILSTMMVGSSIALAVVMGPDIVDLEMYRDKRYKGLQHYSGVLMIFSGVLLIMMMKQTLENEHSGRMSKELQEWVSHYPLVFFMTLALTPLFDRLIRLCVLGSNHTASVQEQAFADSLTSQQLEEHLSLDFNIARFKALLLILLYSYSSYLKHWREESNNFEGKDRAAFAKMLD